ncbi:GNAT family N-acetyltransferase [Crateriforma spongiae]|uniref:GNAT family N-acetyltransferase n=1 Tax=Crateriforma spongiae TaxID=2724528 RepID=UPI0014481397|nr:GNAT family N-acetyltransferase [Crateriforma spongiae]
MEFVTIQWCTPLYQEALDLRHEVLRKPLGISFSPEDLDAEHSDRHFGVTVDGVLVATLSARPLDGGAVKFRQMAVAPEHQNKGIGAFLMRNAEELLGDSGVRSFRLHAREEATGFYEKLGYQNVDASFVEVGIPHQAMQKHVGA